METFKQSEPIEAVIFDLDGVLVSTDEQHYLSWKRVADEEGIYFDREINRDCLGLSRMDSLEVLLRNAPRPYSAAEKAKLAKRKNRYFQQLIAQLSASDLPAGVSRLMTDLKLRGAKLAVASGSRNAPAIVARLGLAGMFDTSVSGNDVTRSKPHPEIFLRAADRLGVAPARCLVIEDAPAGVEAALRAGMRAIAISAQPVAGAARTLPSLAHTTADELLSS